MLCYIDYRKVEKPLPWRDLIVEVGFGRGDFTVRLAKENSDRRVLGFELSAISVEKLIKRVKREGLKNVHCARIDAYWGFYLLLEDGSVSRIHMNYPDPWFKKRHYKRRLTKKENLYIFARKLERGGEILIRTDYLPFAEFTIEQAEDLGSFEVSLRRVSVGEPLTKYERRWLEMGKDLYELVLRKVREPKPVRIPEIEEVKELFPFKVEGREQFLKDVQRREFKLGEEVYFKTFDLYEGERGYLLEALLSEEGFVQRFFLSIRRKGEGVFVIDVSPFSEVLRTENLQRAIETVGRVAFKPLPR